MLRLSSKLDQAKRSGRCKRFMAREASELSTARKNEWYALGAAPGVERRGQPRLRPGVVARHCGGHDPDAICARGIVTTWRFVWSVTLAIAVNRSRSLSGSAGADLSCVALSIGGLRQ